MRRPALLAVSSLLAAAALLIGAAGPAPATQDVLGGQVPCGLMAGPTVLPHVRSGKLVALAVSGGQNGLSLGAQAQPCLAAWRAFATTAQPLSSFNPKGRGEARPQARQTPGFTMIQSKGSWLQSPG